MHFRHWFERERDREILVTVQSNDHVHIKSRLFVCVERKERKLDSLKLHSIYNMFRCLPFYAQDETWSEWERWGHNKQLLKIVIFSHLELNANIYFPGICAMNLQCTHRQKTSSRLLWNSTITRFKCKFQTRLELFVLLNFIPRTFVSCLLHHEHFQFIEILFEKCFSTTFFSLCSYRSYAFTIIITLTRERC